MDKFFTDAAKAYNAFLSEGGWLLDLGPTTEYPQRPTGTNTYVVTDTPEAYREAEQIAEIKNYSEVDPDDIITNAIPGIDHHTVQFVLDERQAGSGIKAIAEATQDALFFRPVGGLSRKQVKLIINAYDTPR